VYFCDIKQFVQRLTKSGHGKRKRSGLQLERERKSLKTRESAFEAITHLKTQYGERASELNSENEAKRRIIAASRALNEGKNHARKMRTTIFKS